MYVLHSSSLLDSNKANEKEKKNQILKATQH